MTPIGKLAIHHSTVRARHRGNDVWIGSREIHETSENHVLYVLFHWKGLLQTSSGVQDLNAYLSRLLPQIMQFWIFAQCVHHFFYEAVFLPNCSMCSLRMCFGGDDRIQCGNPNVGLIPISTAKIG